MDSFVVLLGTDGLKIGTECKFDVVIQGVGTDEEVTRVVGILLVAGAGVEVNVPDVLVEITEVMVGVVT